MVSKITESKIEPAINVKNLSKHYSGSQKAALSDLSLKIYPGEVYGFLGPNGAGKSTTIRTLLNFIQPTSGRAKILGYDIVENSLDIRKSLGYLSGDFAIYPKMTGRKYLAYMSDLQGNDNRVNIEKLAKRLNADLDKKLSDLSRGNRQKIGLIQAFMHEPKIIILDEPSSGLDPLMQETFYDLVHEAKERGAAVFMSSHILSEVQKTCDRFGIIREGKLIDEGNISEMAVQSAQTFDIVFSGKVPLAELKKIKDAKVQDANGDLVTVHMNGELSSLFAVLAKHDVQKIDTRNLDLEETFLGFYENGDKK